ncbi:hypothetical protein RFI_34951, partial [Reticulomyxa filosa]
MSTATTSAATTNANTSTTTNGSTQADIAHKKASEADTLKTATHGRNRTKPDIDFSVVKRPDETKDRSKSQASKENLLTGISPAQSGTQSANNDTAGSPPPKKTEKAIKLPANELTEKDFFKKYWIEAGKIGQLHFSLSLSRSFHSQSANNITVYNVVVVARGAFSKIRKISRKSDKKIFALKMIDKKGKSQSDIRALQKEIYVLQR